MTSGALIILAERISKFIKIFIAYVLLCVFEYDFYD